MKYFYLLKFVLYIAIAIVYIDVKIVPIVFGSLAIMSLVFYTEESIKDHIDKTFKNLK